MRYKYHSFPGAWQGGITYEEETSDIVNIHTPNSLTISTDVYEYKQLTIPKNTMVTTDIDIYNPYDYELCYSIWYKEVKQKNDDETYIKIYWKIFSAITNPTDW